VHRVINFWALQYLLFREDGQAASRRLGKAFIEPVTQSIFVENFDQ
jgi:hypothetical protein